MLGYREQWMRWIQVGLVLAGLAVLARPVSSSVQRAWKTWRAVRLWEEARSRPDASLAGRGPAVWLEIPGAEIDTLVVRETGSESLRDFPSLWTPPPIKAPADGLMLIRAHRDLHFRGLRTLEVGDPVSLEWPHGLQTEYRVVETEILDPEIAVARVREKARESWLVLMTCYPFSYIGPAPSRFLVWARPAMST